MNVHETSLRGVLVIEPRVFRDQRGVFFESYQQRRYREAGVAADFVQDNYSRSSRGVLRGLHYQVTNPQAKLVQVVRGEVFDVAVDLRRQSPTFGRWVGVTLSGDDFRQVYIPRGCAHGFYVLSETADFLYKCDALYSPQDERTLSWNDPEVGIEWPLSGPPILSEKDQNGRPLAEAEWYETL